MTNPFDPSSHFNDDERRLAAVDPSWAKWALAIRTGYRFGHEPGEFRTTSLLAVWDALERRRARFTRAPLKNSMELLHAIDLCAQENVPMPSWLAMQYHAKFAAFLKPGGAGSLDSAFRSEALPTSTRNKAESARRDWMLGGQLYEAVWHVAAKHQSLDSALREVLKTTRWNIKKTKARRLIEMVERTHTELGRAETLSRFWRKRRKPMQVS